MQNVAMSCIFLAAKIEENCRRVRDIANVFHHMKQKRMGRYVESLWYTVCGTFPPQDLEHIPQLFLDNMLLLV